ncbi:MAG: hypothetical protein CTY20_07910 [Hyphomicrobium sp.]|nr:MAG: hypothetical protein CTY20_07910 [Hyphomicrobium sp.]
MGRPVPGAPLEAPQSVVRGAAAPTVARRKGVRLYNPDYITATSPRGRAGGMSYTVNEAGIALVEELARAGHDVVTLAGRLGIRHETFADIRRRQPEVAEAWARGRAAMGDEINDLLLDNARKGNMTAAIFLAKGRLGWREVGPADAAQAAPTVNITLVSPAAPGDVARIVGELPPLPADGMTGGGDGP